MQLTQEQIAELKAFCVEHYNDPDHRYDTFVECYDDAEWQDLADDIHSMSDMYDMMKTLASVWNERQRATEW